MKRSLALAAALVFSVLALVLPPPFVTRTARADDLKKDKCLTCLRKVQRDYEKCEERYGGPNNVCDDQFNSDIVACYATVCEQ
ncbi:MAG TPA: hypothetical protein VK421_15745 [Pyrinomonadaceae bacterium]|nr:hypothetical protein [Pyrinomonadaceae bacterium]